jgi:hypothetical protein
VWHAKRGESGGEIEACATEAGELCFDPRRTTELFREVPQNGAQFIERLQTRVNVMVGPYERCDTPVTIEPVRDYTIALREPFTTNAYGSGQRFVVGFLIVDDAPDVLVLNAKAGKLYTGFRYLCQPCDAQVYPLVPPPFRFDRVLQHMGELDPQLLGRPGGSPPSGGAA